MVSDELQPRSNPGSETEIEQYRRALADHDAREQAKRLGQRPAWRVALDDLFVANYHNDAFWFGEGVIGGLINDMHGSVDEDDMRITRNWFAGKCRICQRPMHVTDIRFRCRRCGADVIEPTVITGTTVGMELES